MPPKFPFTIPTELCKVGYEDAYKALPEEYKNDSVLTFSLDGKDRLIATCDILFGSWKGYIWCADCGEWFVRWSHKVAPNK